ncbi:tetratricopeptide repeat-containing sensor histidine kinase [Terrimonas sp.]|uniref:tetratricopeptide repeat-containing sensor histidine kinase n=1 Tax=Terrimonas sp. TaxID=1914338 RepID=UPI001403348A|nr:tetratricopeptide repeat protein [Terrimonas sp.]
MPFIILLLLVVSFSKGSAQPRFKNPNDSLLFAQADSAFASASRYSDSMLVFTKALLAKATSSAGNLSLANIHNAMGWAYMHRGFLDSSINSLHTAWQFFGKANDTNGIIRACINIAEVYTKQNKIANAIQYLTQADSLCTATGNIPYYTNVQRQLGVVYREAKDYKQAAAYLNRALAGFLKLQDDFRYISTGISLSILYRNLQLPDSSLYILEQCKAVDSRQPASPYRSAMIQEHLAESYYQKKQFSKALEHFSDAYGIFKKINNKGDVAYEALNVGKVLWQLQRHTEAEKYLTEAYRVSDTLKMLNYQYDIAQTLADMYSQNGQWQKAYQYRNTAATLRDSIDLSNQIKLTNELKEKFETEKKENEIALLKTQNELTEADNRKNRLLQYLFSVLFVASVVIGWLLLNRVRIKRRLNEQLLRNQIAGDLHDDIGSALSVIDISSRIALAKSEEPAVVTEQLQKIKQYTAHTMESMSDIVWSVNPDNDNLESVMTRVREFAAEVCEPLHIQMEISREEELDSVLLNANKRKHVLLLCKEIINNAVKYSGCTLLQVNCKVADSNMIQITISDNGSGFNPETVKKGNGLNNMRTRAAALGGSLTLNSILGQGTTAEIMFPVN